MQDFYSIGDVLSFAIRLEQASQMFYLDLARQPQNRLVSQFLQSLAQEEKLHEDHLKKLLEDQGDVLKASISAEEVVRYVQAAEPPESLDYKEAVKLAMNKEKAAQMLYSVLAGAVEDQSFKKILLFLSAQEKAHKTFFEKEYHRICLGEN